MSVECSEIIYIKVQFTNLLLLLTVYFLGTASVSPGEMNGFVDQASGKWLTCPRIRGINQEANSGMNPIALDYKLEAESS